MRNELKPDLDLEHISKEIAAPAELLVHSLLPYRYEPDFHLPIGSLSERILNRIVPEFKFKLGKGLVDQSKPQSKKIIDDSLEQEIPIPLIVNIGTSKWFDGTNHERNIAGLSELLMCEQLAHIDRRVKTVYERGVQWTVLAENLTNQWLYGLINQPDLVKRNNEIYLDSLSNMLRTMAPSLELNVNIAYESDVINKSGFSNDEYIQLLENNQHLFQEYFAAVIPLESAFLLQSGNSDWDQPTWERYTSDHLSTIQAYKQLSSNGWNGGVHPHQSIYYTRQFEKTGGDSAKNVEYVSAYFGSVLARRQVNFSRLASSTKPIKVSFLRYPKGTGDNEKTAITISQHPLYGYGSCHKRISPWSASTNIEYDLRGRASLRVRPVREMDKVPIFDMKMNYAGVVVPVYTYEADLAE